MGASLDAVNKTKKEVWVKFQPTKHYKTAEFE